MAMTKKRARRKAKKFKLVPNPEVKGFLRKLKLSRAIRGEVTLERGAIVIRIPRARNCFPFAPPCLGDNFFRKVIIEP